MKEEYESLQLKNRTEQEEKVEGGDNIEYRMETKSRLQNSINKSIFGKVENLLKGSGSLLEFIKREYKKA